MELNLRQEKLPWVTCFFTDILLTYVEETFNGKKDIDYPSLFNSVDGFETPSDPESFLRDVNNWVPLTILRVLLYQCEKISGRKDIAYLAARSYFAPGKRKLPSLFEIIVRVLSDVRSVVTCANIWGVVQTNYLKLQSFEGQGIRPDLYILAQFEDSARPAVGTMHLLRGIWEGFPQLYSSNDDVHCNESISQLRIEDILREFPDYDMISEGEQLFIRHRGSPQRIMEAVKVPLKSEVVPLSQEFSVNMPEAVIVSPRDGRIEVLTNLEELDPQRRGQAQWAYKIVNPGNLSHGTFSFSFPKDKIFNAPYSCFRLIWEESPRREVPAESVRKEVSQLLFDHLGQIKQAQIQMIQYNIEKRRLTLENIRLRQEIQREYSFSGIIGESEKMKDLFNVVRSIAETDVTVLIQGETGTGKELIARAIHYNGPRRAKRFVSINCGALTETLLESELFGHEKGAFTGANAQRKGIFEVAHGGTLFLDEIGEISPRTEVKLLRVLQEGEFQRVGGRDSIKVDVRIIAATNQNLEDLVTNGRFRQDLYYRLNVFPIAVPSLKERATDIPLLVSHIIEKHKRNINKQISGISPQAVASLVVHSWPGNIRELENVIQRMMVVCKGEILDIEDLPTEICGAESETRDNVMDLKEISRESAGIVEKRAILETLSKEGGNITRAAKSLGISRATLQNKMKLYGLRDPKR